MTFPCWVAGVMISMVLLAVYWIASAIHPLLGAAVVGLVFGGYGWRMAREIYDEEGWP